jgi:hypothetical protein
MAGVIILEPKKVSQQVLTTFYNIIDNYIESHGFSIIDMDPKIYFTQNRVTQQDIKNIVQTIKTTKDFSRCINTIYSTHALIKN